MNKAELVAKVSEMSSLSNTAATRAVSATLTAITDSLSKGESVTLIGFGTFSAAKRAARDGRNPQTGKKIKIKAKTVAKFKAGSRLADAVN
jgi:DNA-binding protein HU-beta